MATDPRLYEILRTYGEGKEQVWDVQGTNVIKHAALERIAHKAGITFDAPQILEANGPAKCVAICVFGHMVVPGKPEAVEWSIGESGPHNTKDVTKQGKPMATYPYAMAEKRAKDRVILKLIGLHGMVYSEDEADEFKGSDPLPSGPVVGVTALKERHRNLTREVSACTDSGMLEGLLATSQEEIAELSVLPADWVTDLTNLIAAKRKEFNNGLSKGVFNTHDAFDIPPAGDGKKPGPKVFSL